MCIRYSIKHKKIGDANRNMINSYNIKYKKKAPADLDKELTFI